MYTKKFYFDAKNHLPFSELRCDQYPLRREPKRAKNGDFLHVFACDATGIDHIANRRTGGGFSHRNGTFLYTSLSCEINIQILNCVGNFDVVSWRTVARTAGEPWSTPIVMGPHYVFHFKIFEDLIAFHIVANLMGYAESIDISRVCDCHGFIPKSADRCAVRLNQ